MKKVYALSLIIACVFATTQLLYAQTSSLGAAVGLGTANDHVEDGLAAQGYLEVGKNISVRGTLSYYGADAKDAKDGGLLSAGTFTMVGVEASALLKASAEGPYIGGGIGYYKPKNKLSDQAKTATEDDLKSGPGAHAMGGIDIALGKHIILDLNVKYVYFKIDNEAKKEPDKNINLSTLFVTGGIKIRF
ncbi:outer membrane beta-barrel protein [Candidatus Poribacteria bacterium]|nr:outer membrane beta-barrel protein [Candidatus Poribacteria bacterium]